MANATKLKGLVSLVTGGASGLGRGTVERFVSQGSKVVICDLPTSQGQQVASGLGGEAVFVPTDVTSEADVTNALQTAKQKFGKLDVAVNCAGISMPQMTYNKKTDKPYDLDVFSKVVQVNLIGTFNVCRLSAQLMSTNTPNEDGQRGVIINTASVAAFEGQRGQVAYTASKGGIVAMAVCLARDLMSMGIRVNTIAPGFFDTPLFQALPEKIINELVQTLPFPKRLGYPDEYAKLAEAIVDNPVINGECIRIDSGVRMSA